MIPRTAPSCQSDNDTDIASLPWQNAQARAIRDPAELLQYLDLSESLLAERILASPEFTLRVPLGYCQRIEKGNPDDPLLKQVLPLLEEQHHVDGFVLDPVSDMDAVQAPGLLHKYQGRVLIISTQACAIHCRYCFRRHFPYQQQRCEQDWEQALDYIRHKPDIHEVILSGGDPLSLTDSRLKQLTDKLANIAHVKTLRFHTRQPVVLPERITEEFLSYLDSLPWKLVMVIHCNHANEIDQHVATRLKRLHQHHVTLLNQSVLLAGVNDNSQALIKLSELLFENHVLPYYLHMLDKVQGAQHFNVGIDKAQALVNDVRQKLPGYLVPRLVQEIAGEESKTPLF